MTYEQKLLDPRWRVKRNEILERDENECQHCFSRKNLQVHHLAYIDGADPWQHPNEFMVTLCKSCHEAEEIAKREIVPLIRKLTLSGVTYQQILYHIKSLK